MGILDGKVAIITGGGQGIGEGLVYAFCHEGAKVVNIGRTYSKVERVAENIKKDGCDAIALQCDISDYTQVEAVVAKTVETYGKIDVIVNNAMTQRMGPFEDSTEDDLWDVWKNNVVGTYNCIKACLPYLKETKGRIINFGSGAGTHGNKGMFSYATSKEAIRGMTKALAVEFAPYEINVNCVVPTGNSPAFERTKMERADQPELLAKMVEGYLIKRPNFSLGDPETDIGGVVVFLASKYSQYMTGRTLFADGGKSMFR